MTHRHFAFRDVVCSLAEPGWNYGHGRSPFYRYDLEQGAAYCVYNRRLMPVSLASSTTEEGYWALRRDVTRLDTGELPTEILGADAAKLLDRVFTRKVSALRPGRCTYGIACWPDGGILVDGILIRLEEARYWYVQADGDFVGWLRAHALGLDVEVRDPDSWVHQIQGPKALDVLADACDDGMPAEFRYFDAREVVMGGQEVLITRTGWTGEVGFEVYTRPGLDCEALWDHVTAAGARHGMIDIGLDPMDVRRIEAAILNNLSDMDSSMTPFEAGLGAFVDLERPDDFFGKAALLEADRRTRLYGISCAAAEPLIGGPVTRGGTQIGHVTAAGWSPFLGRGIGYVRLAGADLVEPREADVVGFDLATHSCEIVDLPFYDEEKRIPRGLEVAAV
ncbi:MAG: aminomethyltransferase family protein [Gaiellales bacterium]